MLAGDAETGVCVMQLEEGLDTGPVYACERTPIGRRRDRRRAARAPGRARDADCSSRTLPDARTRRTPTPQDGRADARGEARRRRVPARPATAPRRSSLVSSARGTRAPAPGHGRRPASEGAARARAATAGRGATRHGRVPDGGLVTADGRARARRGAAGGRSRDGRRPRGSPGSDAAPARRLTVMPRGAGSAMREGGPRRRQARRERRTRAGRGRRVLARRCCRRCCAVGAQAHATRARHRPRVRHAARSSAASTTCSTRVSNRPTATPRSAGRAALRLGALQLARGRPAARGGGRDGRTRRRRGPAATSTRCSARSRRLGPPWPEPDERGGRACRTPTGSWSVCAPTSAPTTRARPCSPANEPAALTLRPNPRRTDAATRVAAELVAAARDGRARRARRRRARRARRR